jgi:hypothetical protein
MAQDCSEFILNIINILTDEINSDNPADQLFDYQIAFEIIYAAYQLGDYSKIVKVYQDYEFDLYKFIRLLTRRNLRDFIRDYKFMLQSFTVDILKNHNLAPLKYTWYTFK